MSEPGEEASFSTQFFGVFRYSRRALELVWSTSPTLTITLGALTFVAGLLPAATAYVGQLIVDAVVASVSAREAGGQGQTAGVLGYIVIEGVLVAAMAAAQRGLSVCESLLRVRLGHRVNVLILEKALTLDLRHFEDSEFYDKLTRARRHASARPLSLVLRTFGLLQNLITLTSLAGLLIQFSPVAVAVLLLAGVPAFAVEAKFSGDAFRLFRWRAPETRRQAYFESVLTWEEHAKEVKLYDLGPLFLSRYRAIFDELYEEDKRLTLRRGGWGFGLGLLGTMAFYGAYAWIGVAAVAGAISLGQMTMYLMVFKQGQSAVSAILSSIGGMYEDNLYLSNLYEYLAQEVMVPMGGAVEGPAPGDGVRFEGVSFTYPGAAEPALAGIDLHLRPGYALAIVGENGSGKTTLIKLLTRLYVPTEGRILLDGLELSQWDEGTLRRKIGVIFQDFARYQMMVGENIGVGDVHRLNDEVGWHRAAGKAMAERFIEELASGYQTQLGRWFQDGRELSGGQWQKIALARAFMRSDADVFVLDEPTAAMDAEAEAKVFEHFREVARSKMTVLISHRFSTVRMADDIIVLDRGRIVEAGSHETLIHNRGRYAHLFALQAAGYQ